MRSAAADSWSLDSINSTQAKLEQISVVHLRFESQLCEFHSVDQSRQTHVMIPTSVAFSDHAAFFFLVCLPVSLLVYIFVARRRRGRMQRLHRATSDPAGIHLAELQAAASNKARRKRNAMHSSHDAFQHQHQDNSTTSTKSASQHVIARDSRSLLASVYTQLSPVISRVKQSMRHKTRKNKQLDSNSAASSVAQQQSNKRLSLDALDSQQQMQLPLYDTTTVKESKDDILFDMESEIESPSDSCKPHYGLLYIQLLEARLSRAASHFCVLSFGTQVFKTSVQRISSSQPVFAQKVRLLVKEREWHWPIVLSVYSKTRRSCTLVGRCTMPIHELITPGKLRVANIWHPLSMPPTIKSSKSGIALDSAPQLDRGMSNGNNPQLTTAIPVEGQLQQERSSRRTCLSVSVDIPTHLPPTAVC